MPLFESQDSLDRAKFMFKLMDFDNDGYLHASDMIQTQEHIDPESDFGQEIQKLMDYSL